MGLTEFKSLFFSALAAPKTHLRPVGLVFLLASLVSAGEAWAQVEIPFEGVLAPIDGAPVEAILDLEITLHDDETGGAELFREPHDGVSIVGGYFHLSLGSIIPFPANLYDRDVVYLSIALAGGGPELGPRQKFGFVPYALHALSADTAGPIGAVGPIGPIGATGPTGELGPPGPTGEPGPPGAAGGVGAPGPIGATGAAGPMGANGPAGATGGRGATGPTGPVGNPGAIGPRGVTGVAGPSGVVGAVGAVGATGPLGSTGPQGATGPRGATGALGSQGPQGLVGLAGPIGAAGAAGPRGNTGSTGPLGPTGAAGPQGAAGLRGATGATGVPGPTGNLGPIGAVGPTGVRGPTGINGALGPRGPTGVTGAAGPRGPTGVVGPTGATGPRGPTGPIGPTGAPGAIGLRGPTGANGPRGPTGISGIAGAYPIIATALTDLGAGTFTCGLAACFSVFGAVTAIAPGAGPITLATGERLQVRGTGNFATTSQTPYTTRLYPCYATAAAGPWTLFPGVPPFETFSNTTRRSIAVSAGIDTTTLAVGTAYFVSLCAQTYTTSAAGVVSASGSGVALELQ
jgi:hypothetical protein